MSYESTLKEEARTLDALMSDTFEGAADRDLSESESATIKAAEERMAVIAPQLEQFNRVAKSRAAVGALAESVGAITTKPRDAAPAPESFGRSVGEIVSTAKEITEYRGGGRSAPVSVNVPLAQTRAPGLLKESIDPGKSLLPHAYKYMVENPFLEYPLLSAVNRIPVNSNAVDIVTYGDKAGAKTPAKVAEGAAKPEVEITASTSSISIDTFAGWVQITRALLQDAPAVRAIVDTELRRGLLTLQEKVIVDAIGAASLSTTTGQTGQGLLEIARSGIAAVQLNGYRANGVLMNPQDAADFDLAVFAMPGWGGGVSQGGQNPWGMQIITSPTVAAGTVYVGDFSSAVTVFERTGVEIFVTDSHAENFVKNVFVILGEQRYNVAVTRPGALTKLALKP